MDAVTIWSALTISWGETAPIHARSRAGPNPAMGAIIEVGRLAVIYHDALFYRGRAMRKRSVWVRFLLWAHCVGQVASKRRSDESVKHYPDMCEVDYGRKCVATAKSVQEVGKA